MERISGIYKIQSRVNPERVYIGSAVNIRERWNDHKCRLRIGKHVNPKLQNHYNKYGLDDLLFSVIAGCHKDDLIPLEQFYIDAFDPWFNVCKVAGSCLGVRCSEEKKQLLREKNMGHAVSDETRRKLSEAKRGIPLSEEAKKKMSLAKTGTVVTEETKRKIARANIGLKHPHTQETKEKISRSMRAKFPDGPKKKSEYKSKYVPKGTPKGHHVPHSEEAKKKMSDARRGKKASAETREKLSRAKTGFRHSAESKKKMSESKKNMSEETRANMRAGWVKRRRKKREAQSSVSLQ